MTAPRKPAPRPDRPTSPPPRDPAAGLDFGDPLSRPSADDSDRGWGDAPVGGGTADDLTRFLDEKPPHHL